MLILRLIHCFVFIYLCGYDILTSFSNVHGKKHKWRAKSIDNTAHSLKHAQSRKLNKNNYPGHSPIGLMQHTDTIVPCNRSTYLWLQPCPWMFKKMKGFFKCLYFFPAESDESGYQSLLRTCEVVGPGPMHVITPYTREEALALMAISPKMPDGSNTSWWVGIMQTLPDQRYKYHSKYSREIAGTPNLTMWKNGKSTRRKFVKYPPRYPKMYGDRELYERCVIMEATTALFIDNIECVEPVRHSSACQFAYQYIKIYVARFEYNETNIPVMGDIYKLRVTLESPVIEELFLTIIDRTTKQPMITYQFYEKLNQVYKVTSISPYYTDGLIEPEVNETFNQNGYTDRKMCIIRPHFLLTFLRHNSTSGFTYKWCSPLGCKTMDDTTVARWPKSYVEFTNDVRGFIGPSGMPPKLTIRPSFTCVCRLGKTLHTWVGIYLLPNPDKDDSEYIHMSEWFTEYWTNGTVKRKSPDTDIVSSKISRIKNILTKGGFRVEIGLKFGYDTWKLHKSRVKCHIGTPNVARSTVVTKPILIDYPPRKAQLTANWPGQPGEMWANVPLHLTCKSYIGSSRDGHTPEMEWMLQIPNPTTLIQRRVRLGAPSGYWHGLKMSNTPDQKRCGPTEQLVKELGACVRIVVDPPQNWVDARQYCRDQYGYDLAIIRSRRHLEILKESIPDDGFFIGLHDRVKEGKYFNVDGSPANIEPDYWHKQSEEDKSWRDRPSKRNCGVIFKTGLEMFKCENRLSFICQSKDKKVHSRQNFDPKLGNFITSVITINPNTSLEGIQLKCASYPFDWPVPDGFMRAQLNSASTGKLIFKSGQTIPKLSVSEKIVGKRIVVNVTCEAQVGQDASMSFVVNLRRRDIKQTWILRGKPEDINGPENTPRVFVDIIKNTENRDTGHFMVSTMKIFLTYDFHRARVICYPFNINNTDPVIESFAPQADLYALHKIDVTNLNNIVFSDVQWKLGEEFGKNYMLEDVSDSTMKPGAFVKSTKQVDATLVAVACALFIAIFLSQMRVDRRRRRNKKISRYNADLSNSPEPSEEGEEVEIIYMTPPDSESPEGSYDEDDYGEEDEDSSQVTYLENVPQNPQPVGIRFHGAKK